MPPSAATAVIRTTPRMFDAMSSLSGGASGLGQWGDLAAKVEHDTIDLSRKVQPAYAGTFPDTDLGRQLVLTARLINANLGVRVFSTSIGGFDTHSDQAGGHAQNLAEIDAAIEAFFTTVSRSWRKRVTLMTFSEFGRRPERNDTVGTDHGTAAPLLLVGARVKGGLYGAPSLTTSLDGNGNLKYHTDFRQVYATVLDTWLGADSREVLGYTFPNLGLFDGGPTGSSVATVSSGPFAARPVTIRLGRALLAQVMAEEATLRPGVRVVVVRDVAHVVVDVVIKLEVGVDDHRQLRVHVRELLGRRVHTVAPPHDHRHRADLTLGDPAHVVLVEPLGDARGLAQVAVVRERPSAHGCSPLSRFTRRPDRRAARPRTPPPAPARRRRATGAPAHCPR